MMAEDEHDIQQSLRILLGTSKGERFMQPGYGLNLQSQLFDNLNTTARELLIDRIKRTLLVYESRINLLAVNVDDTNILEGKLLIEIDYVIRANNSRFNLVYPYYLHDGTQVDVEI